MKTHSLRLLTKTSFCVICPLCATGAFAAPSMPADVLGNYGFWDMGRVWGKSTFGDKTLIGTGFGVKYNYESLYSVDFSLGFPIKRNINEERQDGVRVHATLTATF